MRLFIAIEPGKEVEEYLESLQSKLSIDDAKLTMSKGHHLTLKFLGDVEETSLEAIKAKLREIKISRFRLTTSAIGFFPDAKNPRVIWVGVEPQDIIKELHKEIESALREFGFENDFKLHPHLTLARVKSNKDYAFVEDIQKIETKKIMFEACSFSLFKSDLEAHGPIYTQLIRINVA